MSSISSLESYIKVYNGAIAPNTCDFILKKFHNYEWHTHTWSTYKTLNSNNNLDSELSVCDLDALSSIKLSASIVDCVTDYAQDRPFKINGYNKLRANKYSPGTHMKKHVDHIHTIFDGNARGIPVLSIVCLLNHDFGGGEFVFFDDYNVKLQQGDILIFPSVFLYPHRVKPVTNGTRYSVVQWAY